MFWVKFWNKNIESLAQKTRFHSKSKPWSEIDFGQKRRFCANVYYKEIADKY